MGTREMSDEISPENPALCWFSDGRSFLSSDEFEILLVGCNLPKIEQLPSNCRLIELCSVGYYGWKNRGAKLARGRYILFSDSDCRPSSGYLERAISTLESDPSLSGVTGATKYDGNSYLTRLNTVLCFGFLHKPRKTLGRFSPMGHNLLVRKKLFPEAPFGPFTGRIGGDQFIARYLKKIEKPLRPDPRLLIYHEDISYHIRLTIEQHFREIYKGLLDKTAPSRFQKVSTGFLIAPLNALKRVRRLFKYGKYLRFRWWEILCALPILFLLGVFDLGMVLFYSLFPALFDRALKHMIGEAR